MAAAAADHAAPHGAPELVGLTGASIAVPADLPNSFVMTALREKTVRPDLFLPVKDVVTRPIEGGIYREMTFAAGPMVGQVMKEHIFVDDKDRTVIFHVQPGSAAGEQGTEHMNEIVEHAGTEAGAPTTYSVDFYLRDATTKQRVPWHAPKALALGGIEKVIARARVLQQEAAAAAAAAAPTA